MCKFRGPYLPGATILTRIGIRDHKNGSGVEPNGVLVGSDRMGDLKFVPIIKMIMLDGVMTRLGSLDQSKAWTEESLTLAFSNAVWDYPAGFCLYPLRYRFNIT